MTNKSERMRILEQVEKGELSADEGIGALSEAQSDYETEEIGPPPTPLQVLEALDKGEISAEQAREQIADKSSEDEAPHTDNTYQIFSGGESRRGRFWQLLLATGVGLILISALWMNARLQSAGYDFWFFSAWLPLAIGVLLVSLGWASRNSSWLSVKIHSSDSAGSDKLHFHIPLPLGILRWAIFRFEHRINGVNMSKLNELLASKGPLKEPIVIQFEDDDGDEIEAIIA
jgi:hypothetical protein